MFLDWKNQYCKSDYTTQSNLQMQCNLYQNSYGSFFRNGNIHPKIHMEFQWTLNSQNNFEKEEQSWRSHTSGFQKLLQSYSNPRVS